MNFFRDKRGRYGLGGICLAVLLLAAPCAPAFTEAGLRLSLAVDEAHQDLRFTLGQEPVKLLVAIANIAGEPVATRRGFSQVELYTSVVVTDPAGVRHVLGTPAGEDQMPPPFYIGDRPWGPAETLPAAWSRSATIVDLRQLVPSMNHTAGWYTIEADLYFTRYATTGQNPGLGLLALLDHPDNWRGRLVSNKLQIYLAPPRGAKLRVQVIEAQGSVLNPVAQAPVRVFKNSGDPDFDARCDMNADGAVNAEDLALFAPGYGGPLAAGAPGDTDGDGFLDGADLAVFIKSYGASGASPKSLWETDTPVLSGTTDLGGWAVWETGLACLGEDDYLAVAFHLGQYRQAAIGSGEGQGWNQSCEDSIARKITFGVPPPTASGDLNADGCVDMADYAIIAGVIQSPPPRDPIYDLNSDGLVNIADARYLVLLFSNPGGAACQ